MLPISEGDICVRNNAALVGGVFFFRKRRTAAMGALPILGGLLGSEPAPPAPTPAPTPVDDTAEKERQERTDALVRRRRGREATIATSPRGLLDMAGWLPRRKSLLGE